MNGAPSNNFVRSKEARFYRCRIRLLRVEVRRFFLVVRDLHREVIEQYRGPTGALERPLVFANNDRPGVMLASAVRAYVNRYAVKPGSRAVVFTNNDGAYETALDLRAAGIAVVAVDVRHAPAGPGGRGRDRRRRARRRAALKARGY